MIYSKKLYSHILLCGAQRLFVILLLYMTAMAGNAQTRRDAPPKKGPSKAQMYPSLPSGYTQVGSTQLYYNYKNYSDANNIDVIGYYNGYYYSSTYNDGGYKLSVKVDNYSAVRVDCLNGTNQ